MARRPAFWLDILSYIWPLTWISGRAYAIPIVGRFLAFITLPLFSKNNLHLTYIPVGEEIAHGRSECLPEKIVTRLIMQSSHRAIINRCTCRDDRTCKEHPIDLGCMLLGDGAKAVDPRISRHVTKDEAIAHAKRAAGSSLIPLVGRARIDNFIYGIPDHKKLLTICFCCPCCCTIFASGRYLPQAIAEKLVPIGGVEIRILPDACNGCGVCADACFMGALDIRDGIAFRKEDLCKRCGRCVAACGMGAIIIKSRKEEEVLKIITDRLRGLSDFQG